MDNDAFRRLASASAAAQQQQQQQQQQPPKMTAKQRRDRRALDAQLKRHDADGHGGSRSGSNPQSGDVAAPLGLDRAALARERARLAAMGGALGTSSSGSTNSGSASTSGSSGSAVVVDLSASSSSSLTTTTAAVPPPRREARTAVGRRLLAALEQREAKCARSRAHVRRARQQQQQQPQPHANFAPFRMAFAFAPGTDTAVAADAAAAPASLAPRVELRSEAAAARLGAERFAGGGGGAVPHAEPGSEIGVAQEEWSRLLALLQAVRTDPGGRSAGTTGDRMLSASDADGDLEGVATGDGGNAAQLHQQELARHAQRRADRLRGSKEGGGGEGEGAAGVLGVVGGVTLLRAGAPVPASHRAQPPPPLEDNDDDDDGDDGEEGEAGEGGGESGDDSDDSSDIFGDVSSDGALGSDGDGDDGIELDEDALQARLARDADADYGVKGFMTTGASMAGGMDGSALAQALQRDEEAEGASAAGGGDKADRRRAAAKKNRSKQRLLHEAKLISTGAVESGSSDKRRKTGGDD